MGTAASGRRIRDFLRHLLLACAAICFSGPLLWLVLASFKSADELLANPFLPWPRIWQTDNYVRALDSTPVLTYFRNTALLCAGSVAGTLLSCSMAAYGFARLRWPGRDVCFAVLIATLLLPWQVTLLPRFLLLRELGLYNTLWALIVPAFCGDAFFIFLLRQMFRSIPEELSEAARLEGANEWQIYWHLVLPLARPALTTVALLQTVACWNDFQGPLALLNDPEKFPLSYGLERLVSSYSTETGLLLAAAVLFVSPLIVLFLFAQRQLLRSFNLVGEK